MQQLVHSFDEDDGYYVGSTELPPGAVGANPEFATLEVLPLHDPQTQRLRRINRVVTVEAIPKPAPEPEPDLPTLEQVKAFLQARTNSEYSQRMNDVAMPYPQYERESWPVQIQEAQALATDLTATTPWIDACAAQRGIDRSELGQRILGKDSAYRLISGQLTGARQAHEAAIDALPNLDAALKYDVTAAWPM